MSATASPSRHTKFQGLGSPLTNISPPSTAGAAKTATSEGTPVDGRVVDTPQEARRRPQPRLIVLMLPPGPPLSPSMNRNVPSRRPATRARERSPHPSHEGAAGTSARSGCAARPDE